MAVPRLYLGLLVRDQRRSSRFYETYFGFDEVTASYGRPLRPVPGRPDLRPGRAPGAWGWAD
jgi:catechol 2,3-dioxygenase-like lactoylglutathione lyase family enzyme